MLTKLFQETTYSGATGPFTPPATPTDCFYIGGSASKIVRVFRMFLSTVQTAAGINDWRIRRRSTADTAGTPVATTVVSHDQGATATALMQHYTANPTLGSTVGDLWMGRINSPILSAGNETMTTVVVDFVLFFGEPIVLRGTAQGVAWNFNGAALPAGLSVCAGATISEGPA